MVLGFCGLWLAPLLERMLPALARHGAGLADVGHRLLRLVSLSPIHHTAFSAGNEAADVDAHSGSRIGGCLWAHSLFEVWWFDGNIKTWLSNRLGIQYDQRNAWSSAFVMGLPSYR